MNMTAEKPFTITSVKKFGCLFASLFACSFFYFRFKHFLFLEIACASISIFFIFATIFRPLVLAPLNRAWFSLSLFLGKVVSPVVIGTIFFVTIVPVSLIMRIFGRDVLKLKKREIASYWLKKEPIDVDSFKNQF